MADTSILSATAAAAQPIRFGLAGRVLVVTGAARGIGAACARRLAAEGAPVALWDVDGAAAQALADELTRAGQLALACTCNVAHKVEVEAALQATLAAFGRIDGLVNNAGIFRAADFLEVEEADWDAVIAVNLKGSFLVGQAVARQMVAQRRAAPTAEAAEAADAADAAAGTGTGPLDGANADANASAGSHAHAGTGTGAIVNMSSVNGTLAIASIASYNASKGGINQLTRAMALALADHGIRVNAVAPGTIATELARSAVLTSEDARQRILGRTPMKRLGEPDEVADVVAFLLSDAARYMTGEIVHVDGGRMALNYTVPV